MKIKKSILLSIVLFTFLFSITACKKPSTKKLTGKWELVSMDNKAIEADEKIVFEFRSDGTFDFVADSNAVLEGSQTGDWLWYNNKSTLELTYNTTSILTFRELTLNDEEFIATLNSFVVFDMKKID